MADVKIPVSATVQGVTNELDKIPQKVEVVAKKINRFKWQVIDLKAIEADLKRLEQMVAASAKRMGGAGVGPGGGNLPAVAPGVPGVAPGPLYRPPAQPRSPGGWGGGGGSRPGGPGAYTHAPQWWDVGRNFMSGVGGGFGQIGAYGVRGGLAGFRGAGLMGAGMGLLGGLGIGALAYGAFKIGQGVNEGYELAKERNAPLDTIKRQMGDLGVSFARLKMMSEAVADGMQMNAVESAKLMEEMQRLSRGADRSPDALAASTRTGIGLSRAYGLDPAVGVSFIGSMRNIDPRQNNRELALLLADTIEGSGMNARADEVMQVIQAFAATTSRMSLSAPNLSGFAGAYASLVGSGTPGMTSEAAAGLLGQANGAIMGMGGAGEAGRNFILAAMQRSGTLNPIQASALSAGGLFGTRASVFGPGTALGRYFGAEAASLAGGPGANVTTFQAIKEHLDRMGGDRWLKLEGAQRLFGLSSPQQAASLLNMDGGTFGKLGPLLNRAGVDIRNVNESGIQTLGKIASAPTGAGLSKIFAEMAARTGTGALSQEEVGILNAAQGGDTEKFREALARVAANKGKEDTEHSLMKDQASALEQIKINTGDKLIGPITSMQGALNAIARTLAPDSEYSKAAAKKEAEEKLAKDVAEGKARLQKSAAELSGKVPPELLANAQALGNAALDRNQALGNAHFGKPSSTKEQFIKENYQAAAAAAAELGIDPNLLLAQLGLETAWGKSVIPGSNNLGNIKAGRGWKGVTVSAVDNMLGTRDNYRAYDSKEDFFRDYAALIRKRYPGVIGAGSNVAAFTGGLVAGGYAEDPGYGSKIENIYNGLTALPGGAPTAGATGSGTLSPVEVPLILLPQNQQGQPVGRPATATVAVPSPSGRVR